MKGQELFETVFEKQLERYYLDLGEIEDVIGVTEFEKDISHTDGWRIYYTNTFKFNGEKYSFEESDHTSDNVCDREYYVDSFEKVENEEDELNMKIDEIIERIKDEYFDSLEEIIVHLELLKK